MMYQQNIMEHELIARREGMEQGLKQGREQGVEQTRIKNVLRMFSRNFSLEDIALMNDISIEQVERIISRPYAPC